MQNELGLRVGELEDRDLLARLKRCLASETVRRRRVKPPHHSAQPSLAMRRARYRTIVPAAMDSTPSFHLSLQSDDLPRQRAFYTEVLGCKLARTAPNFEDYDFFGHQLTFHRSATPNVLPYETLHFGATLSLEKFEQLQKALRAAGARFLIEPEVQAAGTPDERRKLVALDPSGYAIEFKCYVDPARALVQAASYPRIPARET